MKYITYVACTLILLPMLATSCSFLTPDKYDDDMPDEVVTDPNFPPVTDKPAIDASDKPRPREETFPEEYRFPTGPEKDDVQPAVEKSPAPAETETIVAEPTAEEKLEQELLGLFKKISVKKGGTDLLKTLALIQEGKPHEAYEIVKDTVPSDEDKLLVQQVKTYLEYKLGDSEKSLSGFESLVQRVRSEMPISVDTLKFCRRVMYYSKYDEFSQLVFESGEKIIVYSEPERFCCVEGENGFLVSLSVRYLITDSNGKTIWNQDYSLEHKTRKYVYDFFTCRGFNLPSMVDGNYTLSIEIQDKQSTSPGHIAKKDIVFEIRARN